MRNILHIHMRIIFIYYLCDIHISDTCMCIYIHLYVYVFEYVHVYVNEFVYEYVYECEYV